MAGNSSELIKIDEEFTKDVEKVKRALNELVATHPFDPELPTVVVVDTSLKQTGGFIYQMDGRVPKFVAFYSRNRIDAERKVFIGSCHIEVLGFGGMLQAFFCMFQSAKLPITLITDSSSFVKLFAKFKRNEIPSTNTAINNVFYYMGIILNFNVIHMKNTEAKMMFSDGLSRITEILGLPMPKNECVGAPQCKVCDAANMLENGTKIAQVMEKFCKSTLGIIREAGRLGSGASLPKDLQIFSIRKEPPLKKIHFARIRDTKYRLESLLQDTKALEVLQMKSPDLRKLRRALEEEVVNFPKHEMRLQRMLDDENAELYRGVVYLTKMVDGVARKVIPLPPQSAPIAIGATHETVGHRSITQLVKQVLVHFWFPKAKEMITAFVDSCVRCSLERGGGKFLKKMKPVPVPEQLYTTIVMDEMVRSVKTESVRFMVAMEGLSQFITCVVYEGAMTGPKFLAMVASCKTILCPHGLENTKIDLRVDGAAWHTSAVVRECLAELNVELRVHQSTTFSKNILPELDVKMKQIGDHIELFMESSPVTMELAVHLAAAKCNSTIGSSGYSPAEIFSGRGWKSNEMIQIDVRELLEGIVKRRESHRLRRERERAAERMKKELKLVPYDDPELNSPLVANQALVKIRVGDWVILKRQHTDDKNEVPSAWMVLDISFPKKLLQLKKTSGAETGHGEAKWIAFELVDKVFPKEERIYHVQMASELDEFNENEADEVWLEGRRNVANTVLTALLATHELWPGPRIIEEELVPNLEFSRVSTSSGSDFEIVKKEELKMSELPQKVLVTPMKEEWEEDEEFLTPECSTPFVNGMQKEEKVKKEFKDGATPPKLQLDWSLESEDNDLKVLDEPSPKGTKKKSNAKSGSVRAEGTKRPSRKPKVASSKPKPKEGNRKSSRESKPVVKYQAGQNK